MISLIDALVINLHAGVDFKKVVEDFQIVNNCSEEDAVEALVDKYVKSGLDKGGGG